MPAMTDPTFDTLEALATENLALRTMLKGGCDANNDGPHELIGSGRDEFCHKCGEMTTRGKTRSLWVDEDRIERVVNRVRAAHSHLMPKGNDDA